MSFEVLPTVYDLSTPGSNLALYDEDEYSEGPLSGVLPDYLEQNRFLWGVDLIPLAFGAMYGYRRGRGSLIQAALWGLAGYMAPLPVVSVALYEQNTGSRVF